MSAIVNGSLAGAESPMPRLSKTMQSKLCSSCEENGRPHARWVALIPWISSIGSPSPART